MSAPAPRPEGLASGPSPEDGRIAPAPAADDAGWVRVHPASPWIRGWVMVATFLFFALRDVVERWIGGLFGADAGGGPGVDGRGLLIGGGIALGVLLLVGLAFFFSWWFTRFRIGAEEIELKQGWLFRSRRQMHYDRLQAVDLQHPLPARLIGLAVVKVEAADGGGDSALELAYLPKAQAAAVRRQILDRASGAAAARPVPSAAPEAAGGPAAAGPVRGLLVDPEEQGPVLLRVPAGRLIGSVLLSSTVMGLLGAVVAVPAVLSLLLLLFPDANAGEEAGVWAVTLGSTFPLLFSLAGAVWSGLNKGWGFTVRDSSDGLRLRYGFTETVSQTVPPGRVQGVEISQPLFWRPFGWHRVKVSVAGYGGLEAEGRRRDVALPVGPWEDVLRVLQVVAPDPGLGGDARAAGELMRTAMTGSGEEGGFRHVPRRAAWWWHWLTWRRHGYALTPTLLVVRHGRLSRSVQTVQHERLQAVALTQGPVQRRLRVATLRVHMAGGAARLRGLDEDVLAELFEVESRHAAVSRRLTDRNRWMLPEELERFERRTAEVARTEVGRAEMAAAGVVPMETGPRPGDTPPVATTEHRGEETA
ncbi:PH domain-containing protein [Micrococcus porci]|uniref:PH domain-containing protein n=1 Tax=Micrococcus TaxID=1269 RepID=UPI001CC95EFD|nr:PH domain-containing protein [Micrococcus porci]MCG7423338.1 PH domain-containing protein [Micrococcus sp. ACRRV]UBH24859.1 PH domain-containing protein [Micrococcus porci]